jgi:hypothetical protein
MMLTMISLNVPVMKYLHPKYKYHKKSKKYENFLFNKFKIILN